MAKRRKPLPISREDGVRLVDATFQELRHTGTIVSMGFLIAATILRTVDGLNGHRWLLSVSMLASVIATACLSAAAWYLIMVSAKKLLPEEKQQKIDYAEARGGSGSLAALGFWSVAVAVVTLVAFILTNF